MRTYVTAAAFVLGLAASAAAQPGAILIVNSTADGGDSAPGNGICAASGGACTLRAAIQEANALAGTDTIQFAIASGVQTIDVGSALPAVTSPVVIDGSTQPGFAGAPLVVVHGGSGDGLTVTAGSSTVRGLVINGFSGNGLAISGAGGNVVEGNYIGTNAAGTAAVGNGTAGVLINGSADNRIGGRERAQRNIISGNTGKGNDGGVKIDGGATGNIIQGNFIGSDVTGTVPMGNEGRGVAIHSGSNNFIGGVQPGAGNLIIANRATGVRVVSGTGNVIAGNWIGLTAAGSYQYGVTSNARGIQFRSDGNTAVSNYVIANLFDGILFYAGSASQNLVQGNIVIGNGLHGIGVVTGTGNTLLSNQILDNGYLGIGLSNETFDQVTPNDPGDNDSGTNGLQNFPVIASASTSGAVSGSLNSKGNQTFTVQLFANPACDASGHGEGGYYIGQTNVTTNASGNASFGVALGFSLPAGWSVTSTATDTDGNTSEFSACKTVQ